MFEASNLSGRVLFVTICEEAPSVSGRHSKNVTVPRASVSQEYSIKRVVIRLSMFKSSNF